jgi:rSAM-associated Gly-rich repeat protein
MNKSTLFTAVAALALASPLAISTASAQQDLLRNGQMAQTAQYEGPSQQAQDRDRNREDARRGDHRDRRESWRDDNRESRWDDARHNGYYQNGRWTYGPPSADRYGRANFELGYRPWAVGQSLGYYNGRFQDVDYRREQLRRPARGTRWVVDDRGDYLLINRSGRIIQVVISGNEPRDRRQSWRDARSDARWDDRRHNGYYRDGQWTFGPPEARYGRGEVVYGYQPWQRGQRLGYYQGRYSEVDYRTDRRLRAPPRGYHWVRNDSGDLLLAAIAGGLITAVILNNVR